jgi:hypothetical protein
MPQGFHVDGEYMTLRTVVGLVVLALLTLTALGGLGYAWWHWKVVLMRGGLPLWRRVVAAIGILAVTAQAVLFFLFWTIHPTEYLLFGKFARWTVRTFCIAIVCVPASNGRVRRWLLSSSILLFVICCLFSLTA